MALKPPITVGEKERSFGDASGRNPWNCFFSFLMPRLMQYSQEASHGNNFRQEVLGGTKDSFCRSALFLVAVVLFQFKTKTIFLMVT